MIAAEYPWLDVMRTMLVLFLWVVWFSTVCGPFCRRVTRS